MSSNSVDAGAGLRRGEAHRNQVALAQRLLERRMQLLGRELLALLEVERHQLLVDLDHLVDERASARPSTDEKSASPSGLKKQSTTSLPPCAGRLIGRHSLPKTLLDAREQAGQIDVVGVDLVDDDHAAQPALGRGAHHALGVQLDAVLGVDRPPWPVSTAASAAMACPAKSGMPGVSIRWTWMPL